MKRLFIFAALSLLFLSSCEEDSTQRRDSNNFLGDRRVNFTLNLNLPKYSLLKFDGNTLFIPDSVNFIQGVYIFRASETTFFAFELAEPNHPIGTCTIPKTLNNGNFVYTCGEETTSYNSLGTRNDGKEGFQMRRYNVIKDGNFLTISF